MFLANGNLYIFRFPQEGPIPTDLRENPQNYFQNLVYSSGTQNQTLNVGWTDKDISTGVSGRAGGNMLVSSNNGYDPLEIGQSMYSSDGKLKLTFNSDYSLVLYTGDPNAVGCTKDLTNNMYGYGGIAVNQINDMNTDGDKNLGKIAYVNRLGTAYEYNDRSLIHYSDKYTTNPGYTIKDIDTNKSATKFNDTDGFIYDNTTASIARCDTQCSKSGTCVGTIIDNNSCYLLTNINDSDVMYKDSVKGGGYNTYPKQQLYGYDIGNYGIVSNPDECLSKCDNIDGCVGAEYWNDSGYCFPKNKDGPPHISGSDGSTVYLKNMGQSQPVTTLRIPSINKENKPTYTLYPN